MRASVYSKSAKVVGSKEWSERGATTDGDNAGNASLIYESTQETRYDIAGGVARKHILQLPSTRSWSLAQRNASRHRTLGTHPSSEYTEWLDDTVGIGAGACCCPVACCC